MDVTFPEASQAIGTVLKETWYPDWWHCTDTTQTALPAIFHLTAECKVFNQNGGVPLIEPMKSKINEDGVNLSTSMIEQVHFVICSSELYNPASQSSK